MKKSLIKALSLLLVLCFFTSALTSCSTTSSVVTMKVNDKPISEDVFVYFLDYATVTLGTTADYETLKEHTMALINKYYKTNSLAHAEGIVLSTAQKAEVSQQVNSTWTIFGDYYTHIGITRETLTKVYTADAYRDAILLKYYGQGGPREISETRLYASFHTNYVVFQAITGYLTETDENGNKKPLSKSEAETLLLKFQNILAAVNAGEQSMEQASLHLASTGVQSSVQTVVLHKDDTTYPQGFFEKIQNLKAKNASVIATNEYIFLVLRGETNIKSQYFQDKKTEIVKAVASQDVDNLISKAYVVNSTVNDDMMESYLSIIQTEKGLGTKYE